MVIKQYARNALIIANLAKSKNMSIINIPFKTEDFDSFTDHYETVNAAVTTLESNGFKVTRLFGRDMSGFLTIIKLKVYVGDNNEL